MPQLPPEILLSIFPRAIPPHALLDTALARGNSSAWCQTLRSIKSILLVSRLWYNVAVSFLYQNICIRRFYQLDFLRATLCGTSSAHLASLVKSIAIECHVPEGNDILFIDHLQAILPRCSSLSTFAYEYVFKIPSCTLPVVVPVHITHLRLDDNGLKFFDIVNHLESFLLSFHLTLRQPNFETKNHNLSSLQSLSVQLTHANSKFQVLNTIRAHWTMPSLQRFTLAIYCFSPPINYYNVEPDILGFLVRFGGHLQQLHICVGESIFRPESFKLLLSACPQLQRIILHPSTLYRHFWSDSDLADFFHPSLRHIDFTHLLSQLDTYDTSNLCLSKEHLPALESVRRFCNFPHDMCRWLDDYPPSPDPDAETFVINIFHHQLDCVAGLYVWRFEPNVLMDIDGGALSGSFTVWIDSDDDDDYVLSDDLESESDSSSEQGDEEWPTDDGDI